GQAALAKRVGGRQNVKAHAHGDDAQSRVFRLGQRLDLRQAVAGGEPAEQLLMQTDDLRLGLIEISLQAPRPAQLIGQTLLEPALAGRLAVNFPPAPPAIYILREGLPRCLYEGLNRAAADLFIYLGTLLD